MKDKRRKRIRNFISVLILAGILLAGLHVLGYILTPPNFNMHINHELSQIDAAGDTIDLMFVGASRVYHTFVPEIFAQELGYDRVYNFGAANAPYSATYYQLKNMAERYHPSRVIIGVTLDELIDQEWLRGKMVVWDRLNLKGKLEFLFGGLGLKNWKYAVTAYRFRDELHLSNIRYNLSERKVLAETNYAPQFKDDYHYGGNGYISADAGIKEGHVVIDGFRDFQVENINQQALGWLDRCLEFCESHGIDVILTTPPTTMMRLYNTLNYQEAIDFYTDYAREHDVPYYDLNLLRNREQILPDTLMYDFNHVNGEGAQVVSRLFAQMIRDLDNGEDVSSYFYENLAELKDSVHRVISTGCSKMWAEDETAYLELMSFHREDIIPEYQIEILPEGSELGEEGYEVVVPWTVQEQVSFEIPISKEQGFMIKIRARSGIGDEPEAVRYYLSQTLYEGYDVAEEQNNSQAAQEVLY